MKKLLFISLAATMLLIACNKLTDPGEAPRLFRPVLKEALESNGNWIKASWQDVAGSESYTAEISVDTFRTIAASVKLDTNAYIFQNLYWEKVYQVRVKANAADTSHNSKFADLGAIKTARFPTILNIPGLSDVNDNSVKVSWTNSGATVTGIKILLATDSSVVSNTAVTAPDVTNAYKIISGLNGSTSYIIFLYSGTTVRGWANFTTKAPLSGAIIDLRGITGRASVLQDTLPLVASGSIILLKRGETYNINTTLNLSKSFTILAGSDLLNPNKPIIYMSANFNIVAGSTIDELVFNDVVLRGSDHTSKYVFNINTACTIGKVRFENCLAEIFRGVFRTQASPAIITNLEMNNCIVDSVKDYGVFNINYATSRADNIKITNTTIYKTDKVITSSNGSTSVLVENVTVNECPLGNSSGAYIVDFNTFTVTNGITVNNCILGIGRNNLGVYTTRDVRASASTTINTSNNYRTADRTNGGVSTWDLPGINTSAKTSVQLWQDPAVGNFKIIDNTFPGRSTSGDPRWRL